jgi:hypothetical protein
LLVLDTPKAAMGGAPQANSSQFVPRDHFESESQRVDAYRKAHILEKAVN